MSYIRSLIYNILFWTLGPAWVIFVLVPLSFLKSPVPMRRALSMWFDAVFYLLDKIGGIKLEERGLENLPKDQGFILCCKHMSNLEALITYRRLPNFTALAKAELFKVLGFKQVLEKMGVIPIDRGKGEAKEKTIAISKLLLKQKIPLLLFVEGTRVSPGKRKRLKSGVYYMQRDVDIPVICASTNTGVHWLKGSPFNKPGTIIMEYHSPIEHGLSKKDFMARLKENVVIHSEKLMGVEGKDE